MRPLLLSLTLVALPAVAAEPSSIDVPIQTSDVDRFYRVYDAADGRPSAARLQRDYLDAGSPGLAEFARLRSLSGERIAQAMQPGMTLP